MLKTRQVLLIGDFKSFMVNAIEADLAKEGYDVLHVLPDVNAIDRLEVKPDIYLMYLDGAAVDRDLGAYLKDRIDEDEIDLCVIGKYEELDAFYELIPEERLSLVCKRPVNIKELGEKLSAVIEEGEHRTDKKRILVVDDDGTMLRAIKTWLSSKYKVFMVNSGMAAITFLAKNDVDLILLDYEMPITPGSQVLEMLRSDEATRDIPVMFLTNKSDKASIMKVLSLKPEKYLLKTMKPFELMAAINDFFDKQQVEHQTGGLDDNIDLI